MVEEIKQNEVYSTKEAQNFLKISNSTIKRFLKKGIIKANKVGGRYKIIGRELLRLISPKVETKGRDLYYRLKDKTKKLIEKW
jgi:excisionase family DNA binding protein